VKTNLTQAFVQSLEAANVDVYDAQQPGLVLRMRSSGKHSYRVLLKHGQWYTLGSSTVLTPARPFTLAVFATSERRGFKGKKDKDGVKQRRWMRALAIE
jgi:hypothetical protein